MATRTTPDYNAVDESRTEKNVNEKTDITENQVENVSQRNESTDAETENYLSSNKFAVKGDESDGKIVWYWKTRIAAFSLILLYVGQ